MTSPARQRRKVDERHTQLLELGMKLFAERPYDDVSIDDIAEAAGISKGLLYHYFGSKRDLYVATVREAAELLRARIEPDMTLPPAERARSGLEGYLSFVEEHAQSFAGLMRSGIGNDREVAAVVEETRDLIVARMMENMGFARPRPRFRFVLRSWIGMVEAASLDWLARKDVDRESVIQVMTESLYAAVLIAMRLDPDSGFQLDAGVAVPEPSAKPPKARRAKKR